MICEPVVYVVFISIARLISMICVSINKVFPHLLNKKSYMATCLCFERVVKPLVEHDWCDARVLFQST